MYGCGPGTGRDRGGKAGDDDSGTHFDVGWSVRKRSKRVIDVVLVETNVGELVKEWTTRESDVMIL